MMPAVVYRFPKRVARHSDVDSATPLGSAIMALHKSSLWRQSLFRGLLSAYFFRGYLCVVIFIVIEYY